jgi:creatinine amidohydrolase
MRISEMNWMQVEAYLRADDRCVVPLGCTEQHAALSLSVDSILSERVAAEAAEPLGIPVFPAVPYGITPAFQAYPGTVSLRVETYLRLLRDVLDGVARAGFRRILLCNGHGGNAPGAALAQEWMADHPGTRVRWHNWWNAPRTWATVQAIDPVASHASWLENFPWTRLPNVAAPADAKPMTDLDRLRLQDPDGARALLGDGNFGGRYQRPDADMLRVWQAGVEETRALLEGPWE